MPLHRFPQDPSCHSHGPLLTFTAVSFLMDLKIWQLCLITSLLLLEWGKLPCARVFPLLHIYHLSLIFDFEKQFLKMSLFTVFAPWPSIGSMAWWPACCDSTKGGSLAACTCTKKPSLHRRACNPRSKLNLHSALIQLYPLAVWVS